MKTNDTNMIRSISWLSSGLVALLALASFSLSFESLRGLAIETNVVSPELGWIFPLIVDGAIVVFSLSALRASLRKEQTQWLRGLVIFATCGSILFNIAHVEPSWLARILAATPPILLFLSFEALMHSIQAEMERVIKEQVKPEKLQPKTPKPKPHRTRHKKEDRLEQVKILQAEGLTPTEIAQSLDNVSLRTVQRDLANLEESKKRAN